MSYMASSKVGKQIDDLIDAERWEEARKLIDKALKKEPDNHWLLTQLAETYYEQRLYKKALSLLLRSRSIVADCPLTLWHLANTLGALGYHSEALRIYTWILRSKKTPEDDPCWESVEWTDALKTDCVFRMGLCFKHLGKNEEAAHCFRKYIDLTLLGMGGTYSIDEARKYLLQQPPQNGRETAEQELQETGDWVLRIIGEEAVPSAAPPVLDDYNLLQLQEA
jgi:tetratricopeptide (TPR) repeat protein